jgi:rod shape determining protein RodA
MKSFLKGFFGGVSRFFREADMILFTLSLVCAIFGIVIISSIGGDADANQVTIQIVAVTIGIGLFALFSYVDIDIIADKSKVLFVICILFISTLFFWGRGYEEVGAGSWLRFGAIGIQPSEVTKVPFIIIMAKMIVVYRERKTLNTFWSLIKIIAVAGVFLGVIFTASTDVGNPFVYILILLVMLFIGGVQLRWFLIAGVLIAVLTPFVLSNVLEDYHWYRLIAPYRRDEVDPRWLWQTDRSVIAIASGGFLGQGLGNGVHTQAGSAWIPAFSTDFIFTAAAEEFGFIGGIIIILLILAIVIRCVQVGVRSNNALGMLVCTGAAALIAVQMIINVGMTLGITPVIGITLPFFSYGGSSIVTCFAAVGIVSGIKMRPKPARFRMM